MTDVKPIPSWTADPPEWAPYVNGVAFVEHGEVLRVSVDMNPKYLETLVHIDDGRLRIAFIVADDPEQPDISFGRRVLWKDLEPWPSDGPMPVVFVDLGRDLSGYEVAGAGSGRYATNVTLVPRLPSDAWTDLAQDVFERGSDDYACECRAKLRHAILVDTSYHRRDAVDRAACGLRRARRAWHVIAASRLFWRRWDGQTQGPLLYDFHEYCRHQATVLAALRVDAAEESP